jgi:hypothetical protein
VTRTQLAVFPIIALCASAALLALPQKSEADSYTKLLLHMNGADAPTVFTDSSLSGNTVTVAGNAQIDTAQSKFGGASGLFDGNDALTLPNNRERGFYC